METKNAGVIIIGAGLTGLSMAYFLKRGGLTPLVIETSDRPGGVIKTLNEDGFIYEAGPNTGVLSTAELAALFDELSDKCTLDTANKDSKKRYIMKGGRWTAIPSGLFSAVFTPLFTLKDKFRILGEPFRKPGADPDETVADMVVRRLGRSYLDYAVDPFISGVYAGDPSILVTRYALPKLYALEHNYGSFIRGTIKKSREKKSEAEKKATREVFSSVGGLGGLINALADATGDENIFCGATGIRVEPQGKSFKVIFTGSDGNVFIAEAQTVISTAGSYNLPSLLPFLSEDYLSPITNLKYARVVQVAAGYKKWNGSKLDAFGGLVPSKENRNILGILFPSAIFGGRSPEGGALLSVFLGGMRKPDIMSKSDDEIFNIVLDEIANTLNNSHKPDLLKIFRYEHAIPQYEKSSGERLEAIKKIEEQYPGLILAGNIRDGIGMADRVKQAKQVADAVINSRS
ncbi:MAG TPA: protoporphyrinogen oxidase [Bacteroidales bacterium]|nr:protoporphyrinogen oxidase [Bacteroidales bacterium]